MVCMGQLTTHILDTANGIPASGVDIRLFALDGGRELKAAAVTNADGRCEQPLLNDHLGTVVIRFAMHGDQHYHVPLLVSPWSYSTYRGS